MLIGRIVVATLVFLLCSLAFSVALAIVEEAVFEERYADQDWSSEGQHSLFGWFGQKLLFALAATVLLVIAHISQISGWLGSGIIVAVALWLATLATFWGLRSVLAVPDPVWMFWSASALLIIAASSLITSWVLGRQPIEVANG